MRAMLQNEKELKFKLCAENCVQAYSYFWNVLQERFPQFEMFMKAGFDVLDCVTMLEKQWEGFKRRKCVPLNSLRLYAVINDNLFEDPGKASELREFLHEAKESTNDDSLLNFAQNGCAVLTVSGEGETFGKILRYNSAFSQLSGYGPQDLTMKPLEYLIPSIYKEEHKIGISKHFRLAETNLTSTRVEKRVFMTTKSKYITPVVLKIVEAPNYVNGYVYVATMMIDKELSSYDKMHILVNNNQEIVSISSSIFHNILLFIIDCETFIALSSDMLHLQSFKISNLIPNFSTQPENTPFDLFVDTSKFSCVWTQVLSGEKVLGLYLQLNAPSFERKTRLSSLSVSKVDSVCTDNLNRRSSNMNSDYIDRSTKLQFVYHFASNQYYLDSSGEPANKLAYNSYIHTSTVSLDTNRNNQQKQLKIEDENSKTSGCGFYQQVLDRVSKIVQADVSSYVYQRCANGPDYSSGINTYRIDYEGNFRPIKSTDIPMLRQEEFYDESQGLVKKGNRETKAQDNSKILVNAIKSRGHLYRTILNMPLPKVFNGLIILTLVCMLICFGMTIAEKFVLDGVLDNIYKSIDATHTQLGLIGSAVEISTWILQGKSVQLYFFNFKLIVKRGYQKLENTFSKNATQAEFLDWTLNRIRQSYGELKRLVSEEESVDERGVLNSKGAKTTRYFYNGTDVTYDNAHSHSLIYLVFLIL